MLRFLTLKNGTVMKRREVSDLSTQSRPTYNYIALYLQKHTCKTVKIKPFCRLNIKLIPTTGFCFFVKEILNYPPRINVPPLCKLRIIYRSKDTRLYKNVLQFYKGLFDLLKTLPGEISCIAQFLPGMYINGKISS